MAAKIENISVRQEKYLSKSTSNELTLGDGASNLANAYENVFTKEHETDSNVPLSALLDGDTNDVFNATAEGNTPSMDASKIYKTPAIGKQNPSLSNPWFNIRMKNSDGGNYPLLDNYVDQNDDIRAMFENTT